MWDYDISPEEVHSLLKGETDRAGHYTQEQLLIKIFNNLVWYDIIEIIGISGIRKSLKDNIIQKLRIKQAQKKYERIQKILRKQTISPTEQSFNNNGKTPYPILSDRRYST